MLAFMAFTRSVIACWRSRRHGANQPSTVLPDGIERGAHRFVKGRGAVE